MTDVVTTRTPFRVSFFGGGTDFPEWHREFGGATLSTSIDKYCYISCLPLYQFYEHKYRVVWSRIDEAKRIEDIEHPAVRGLLSHYKDIQNIEIHYSGDLPARAGLGSSSAFTVGLIHALEGLKKRSITTEKLCSEAIRFEREVFDEVVGYQDQIAAAYGGLNHTVYNEDGSYEVRPVTLYGNRRHELEDHLVMFFSGIKRVSSDVASEMLSHIKQREAVLKEMQELVRQGLEVLQGGGDLSDFGRLLHENWILKRSLTGSVTNDTIDDIYSRGCKAGAIGGKILGAGGGGFFLFFVKPENKPAVREALNELKPVEFKFENEGSKLFYRPDLRSPEAVPHFNDAKDFGQLDL